MSELSGTYRVRVSSTPVESDRAGHWDGLTVPSCLLILTQRAIGKHGGFPGLAEDGTIDSSQLTAWVRAPASLSLTVSA
jgi:hypothetical protein